MAFELTKENQDKLKEILTHYPDNMSGILPGLHLIMAQRGWVDTEACDYLADFIEVPHVHVYEALTFYTYFPQKPVGKYNIQMCHNIACNLRGAEELIVHLKEKHGIVEGEVTDDGLFSLTRVECLGACGMGPVALVGDEYYEFLDVEKLDSLVEQWRKEAGNGKK